MAAALNNFNFKPQQFLKTTLLTHSFDSYNLVPSKKILSHINNLLVMTTECACYVCTATKAQSNVSQLPGTLLSVAY